MPTIPYNTYFKKLFAYFLITAGISSCSDTNVNSIHPLGINFFESRGVVGSHTDTLSSNLIGSSSSALLLHTIMDLKKHDHIAGENRALFYAYQVGKPQKNMSTLLEHLNQLDARNQCLIMSSAANDYYLIACCYASYQMLNDSLSSFLSKLPYDLVNDTKIIHINDVCPLQHQLTKAESIAKTNQGMPINCLTCN